MADPKLLHTSGEASELPLSTAIGHRARVGDEVRFTYLDDDSQLVTTKARVVFVWPGDVLDLKVELKVRGTRRQEHVRPHLGGELQPNTWWPLAPAEPG